MDIQDISRVRLGRGDILVVRVNETVNHEQARGIRAVTRKALLDVGRDDVAVIVLDPRLSLSVLTEHPNEAVDLSAVEIPADLPPIYGVAV